MGSQCHQKFFKNAKLFSDRKLQLLRISDSFKLFFNASQSCFYFQFINTDCFLGSHWIWSSKSIDVKFYHDTWPLWPQFWLSGLGAFDLGILASDPSWYPDTVEMKTRESNMFFRHSCDFDLGASRPVGVSVRGRLSPWASRPVGVSARGRLGP